MKARLPQGYGGGPGGNMNNMLRQAQKIQEDMAKLQAELEEREYTTKAGGGAVEITITGKKVVKAITLQPEVVDPEDIEMLQDLIIAAVNEAIRNVEDVQTREMEKITGGLSMPGML
ncbi:YbaB/EbfC family nucleoid-associated protein [Zongyangia hominis]|uniref:Nucleoid-associated protein H8709_09690 n=1 Tax=Zongyangia hominis TaxID=2763677 RepID=A0A926ICG3_9FIRM|nr:YbaB/EbfC family nucleoid-associated protein [Zongyangia hominis]MBC8571095.1 YbaB/EbfC family nucleoid-associated protein [Zongyangia hominis]